MNSVDLREQLLDAAISEFAEFGLSGARVDRIAKRAKANKQLIYYYFGDKNGLFDAAVAKMTVRFQAVRSSLPVALADRPAAYFVGASKDTDLIRLLQWEALSAGEGPIVEEGSRAKHMRDGVTTLRSDQKSESAGTDLDAAQLSPATIRRTRSFSKSARLSYVASAERFSVPVSEATRTSNRH
jgi:AcrR family transcriptional regulator